jgi:uncharacterized protein YbbC (DUF1343 family)
MLPKIHIFPLSLKYLLVVSVCLTFCQGHSQRLDKGRNQSIEHSLRLGAERMNVYLPLLEGKRVGLVVNHTSRIGKTHLVDTLISRGVRIEKIFAPEHGFRGTADAGEHVQNERDKQTLIPIVSLYGKSKKPQATQLKDIDVLVFDMQDVGARFYTYISTMHYVMEACAENGKSIIVLDRPNPNGDYIDGPILDPGFRSFVGMHPIPVVHGLTVGELAKMIVGEKWINRADSCKLTVVEMENYKHSMRYEPPVRPSPNLPNYHAIRWYPTLCLFEGTVMSVGRGTDFPFQVVGYPHPAMGEFTFTPQPNEGAKHPLYEGKICYGVDLRQQPPPVGLAIEYVIDFYKRFPEKERFFNEYFDTLCGTDQLRKQIQAGMSAEAIRETWQKDLEKYKRLRAKYMLYE